MKIKATKNNSYFPQPESQGGWRFLNNKTEIKSLASINLNKLNDAC